MTSGPGDGVIGKRSQGLAGPARPDVPRAMPPGPGHDTLLGVAEQDAEGFFQKTLQSGESAGFNWKSIEYAGAAADAKAWADCRPTS